MSPDLSDLYQEIILDHAKRPRNHHALDAPPATSAEGFNPLCGDRLTIFALADDAEVSDLAFQGEGCAISQAAASLLTDLLKGKSRAEVRSLLDAYLDTLTNADAPACDALGTAAALAGVRRFPMRVKCATLAAHTIRAALEGDADTITTE